MTLVATSTEATATAYSNQRKLAVTSNGTAHAILWDSSAGNASLKVYSRVAGDSWYSTGSHIPFQSTSANYTPNGSIFIDEDDYAHVVYKDRSNGYIYYRRGTPQGAYKDYWTWSAATAVWSTTTMDYPDIIAMKVGSDYRAAIVVSRHDSGSSDSVWFARIDITSTGTISVYETVRIGATSYGNTNPKFPSIDFKHNGDGKTISDGYPDLYIAWSSGASGPGYGIRFRRANFSSSSIGWPTWGIEREIDNTVYISGSNGNTWLNTIFDGTRVIIAGNLYSSMGYFGCLWERDASDSATTVRADTNGGTVAIGVSYGSISHDNLGNIYFVGVSAGDVVVRKWDRAVDGTFDLDTTTVSNSSPFPVLKRGYSGYRLDYIYTDGTSPYSVIHDYYQLNRPPTANIATVSGTARPGVTPVTVVWTYSDADSDAQTKYQFRWRKKVI